MDRRALSGAVAWFACVAMLSTGAGASWTAQPRGQVVEIVNAGKCLEVYAPDLYNNGGRVQLWQCNGSKHQEWLFDRGGIRSGAGKCLDAPDPEKKGGRVQIADCNGAPQQRWHYTGKEIRIGNSKCLDVDRGDQNKDGARVQVWECTNTPEQAWDVKTK